MKTRRSLSGKEVLSSLPEHVAVSNCDSPSIVRKLRSRVITSDTEEDCLVRSRTPKSNRKVDRRKSTSPSTSKEVNAVSITLKTDVNPEKKTSMRSKRLSAANLFKIEEVKEEVDREIENELVENECVDSTDNEDVNSVTTDCMTLDEETATVSDEIVKVEPHVPVESDEDTRDEESHQVDFYEGASEQEMKEEQGIGTNLADDELMKGGEIEEASESDDSLPEPVSFSPKSKIISELPMVGEALRKKKRKECVKAFEEEMEDEDDTGASNSVEDEPLDEELEEDSGSDEDMPEAVSFSSSKSQISAELFMIAEAVRKEKEKRKERIRKKIEMIKIQKAEKEERRKEKMKYLDIKVPEKLPEDIASGLPDKPDIPTVKKSKSKDKKRKNEEKAEKVTHRFEVKKNKILKFDDYIPITDVAGSTHFGVVPLEVTSHLPKPSSQSAAEFKRNSLFGSRIRREPSKNLLVYRQKLSAAGRLQKGFTSSLVKI